MPKLLLADDSITIQKVVELVLAEEGYEIRSAGNGEDALQMIPSFKPDIVLADIEMPRMNGYALCDKIKKNPDTAGIPVILLAGAFEPVDEELAQNVGAASFLIKPFESEDLINAVSAALSGKPAPARVEEEAIATIEHEDEMAAPWEDEAGPGEFEEEEEAVEAVEATAEEAAGDLWEAEAVEAEAVEEGEEPVEAVEAVPAGAEDLWEAEAVEAEAVEEGEEAVEAVEAFEAVEEIIEEAPAVEEAVEAHAEAAPEEAVEAVVSPAVSIPTEAIERAAQFEESEPIIEPEAPRPRPAMPDAAQMAEVFAQVARENLGKFIAQLNLKAEIEKDIRQTVENVLWEIAPDMVDRILKESLLKEVEKVVWETVPDLAETVIEREVKKLKSEI